MLTLGTEIRVKRLTILAGAALALAANTAWAEDFDKGDWKLQLTGSYIHSDNAGFSRNQADVGQAAVGVGYYFLDNLGIYADLTGYGVSQDEPDINTWGGGFNLLLRWHFLRGKNWSIYADGGAGVVQFDEAFPDGGTHFNFNERIGLGGSLKLDTNIHLIGGVRYMHLSNARISGRNENPGMDSVEVYTGLMFSL